MRSAPILALAALLLAGCAAPNPLAPPADSTSATGPVEEPPPPRGHATRPACRETGGAAGTCSNPAGGTVEVAMRASAFEPARVYVQQGSTVRWVNADNLTHTVTSEDGGWDHRDVAPGASAEQAMGQEGDFLYWCTIHDDAGMEAVVHVV